jgi:hypothetical protein
VEDCETAIETLSSPDKYSRTPDFEGRRIEAIDGGWTILNHAKYRRMASREDAKEKNAERQKRHRERQKERNGSVTHRNGNITQDMHIADTEVQITSKTEQKNENEAAPSLAPKRTNLSTAQNNAEPESLSNSEEGAACGSLKFSRDVFLTIAERLQVPSEFAETIYADLEISGGLDRSGNRVVSPASFLRACWRAESVRKSESRSELNTAQNRGIREPWQIEGDLKRVSGEVDAIFKGAANRMASRGHTEGKDDYIHRRQDEWIARLRLCREEMQQRFPKDLKKALDEINEEVGDISGVSFPGYDDEIGELVALSEKLPEDFLPFWEWDKRFNAGSAWVDPEALTPEARVKVRHLKALKTKLEAERSNAIANQV